MSISEEVKQRAMATHLFEQMRWMPVLALIPLAIIALVLWEHAPSIPVLLWLVTMTLAEMLLMVVTRLPIGEREVTPKLSLRLFVVLQLGLAVGWVSVLFLFADYLNPWQIASIAIVLMAVAAAGMNSLSWHWPTYAVTMLVLLVPVGVVLILNYDDFLLHSLGLMAFLMLPLAGYVSRSEYLGRLDLVMAEAAKIELTSTLQQRSHELSRMRKQLKTLQDTDSLTGLISGERWKSQFTETYSQYKGDERIAIFFVDIRHFRKINQRWGTLVGDRVILEVAGHLVAFVDHQNVCHLSADEFVFSAPVKDEQAAIELAQGLARYLRLPIQLGLEGVSIHPEPAIGIALFPDHSDDIETLLDYAALANHYCKGKHTNKSYSLFSTELANSTRRYIDLEMGLKQAIAKHELELLYQPQVELESGRIIGAEALLRWHSSTLGAVSPVEFIPVAENSGLILQIGDWVLEQACATLARWQKQFGTGLHLAVNVSAVQLTSRDFAERLARHLERNGCKPEGLHVEITESAIMDNPELAMRVLKKLRLIGVGTALDDFGTGYSSLSYLKDLEIDYLKLDRSFISNVNTSPKDRAITESVIHMAKAIGLKLVAEGIETEEIGSALSAMGCDFGQGWLFGRPMQERALVALARPEAPGARVNGASY